MAELKKLEERLGHKFSDQKLLELALTHGSWRANHKEADSNERLEFLGDAVLGLVVARALYEDGPDLTEGQMSKARASLVNNTSLAEAGRRIGLGSVLRLGHGEDTKGGRKNPSLLANATEAVIGAAFLDAGMTAATTVVRRLLGRHLSEVARQLVQTDFKALLEKTANEAGLGLPQYTTTTSGPEHNKVFHVSVSVGVSAVGEGSTKKYAAQRAAEVALQALSAQQAQE